MFESLLFWNLWGTESEKKALLSGNGLKSNFYTRGLIPKGKHVEKKSTGSARGPGLAAAAGQSWSTPFAQVLMDRLELYPGASVLDIAAGGGIPAFHIAEQVGPQGSVLAVDLHPGQVTRARSIQGRQLPWLVFAQGDMRALPADLGTFDRITGNIAFMFFRPDRLAALRQLKDFLQPGGQMVLTFPALGTFDSLWRRIDREMHSLGLITERQRLADYIAERPSSADAASWCEKLGMERVEATEWPLEIATGPGREFLLHPLLRGGFLDDAYECFDDPDLANRVMDAVAADLESFTPLLAIRCALSAWQPASG